MSIVVEIDTDNSFAFGEFVKRIESQRDIYEAAIKKKMEKLQNYYEVKNQNVNN